MPLVANKQAGDNFYPQYNVVVREDVGAIAITKGRLYTKDASGNLVAATSTSGFIRGIFQASRSIPTAGSAGEHAVDCFAHRSRIGLPAAAGLTAGCLVKYNFTSHQAELFTGATDLTTVQLTQTIGRVYKIYSKAGVAIENDKKVSAAGDIVIIDLGAGL